MQPPPTAGQPPSSSYNPQYSSADNWGSYAPGAHVSSTQYHGPQPVQGNPYSSGGYSQPQGGLGCL